MSRLSGDLVRHQLPTYTFGQNVVYTEQTGSTNTELKKLARWGAPEGLLYLTEEQLVGRGRLERRWHAPPGSSLLMSLLFRPGDFIQPNQAQRLTMLCALALVDAIEAETELDPRLKWPNDLIGTDGKKLAGILTELELDQEHLSWVIVGIGLNVNIDFVKLEQETGSPGKSGNGSPPLSKKATSLSMILGRDTSADRLPILQKYLANVERRYEALRQGELPHQEWSRQLAGLGQPVTVVGLDQTHTGTMTGVDENGALLLEQPDGSVITILAGDISLRLS
ncbi:MAG TPA: biotin--[acetyl-CoA-carboxylase] ligase [Anaerolineae bacterium]